MDFKRGSVHGHAGIKRLGKKALFYARVAPALGDAIRTKKKDSRVIKFLKRVRAFKATRKQLILAAIAVVVLGVAIAAGVLYQQKRLVDAQAAAKAESDRVEKVNAAAQLCYQQKTKQKQSMLGKVTYDQLYDGDSCLTK